MATSLFTNRINLAQFKQDPDTVLQRILDRASGVYFSNFSAMVKDLELA